MKERIKKIIRHYNLSNAEFERRCGLSSSTIQNMVHGISAKKAEGVLRAFPEINRVWLITGEGEMLNTNPQRSTINQVNVGGDNNGSIENGITTIYDNGPTHFDAEARSLVKHSNVSRIFRPVIPEQIIRQPRIDMLSFMEENGNHIEYEPNIPQVCEYTASCRVSTEAMEPEVRRGDRIMVKAMPTKDIIDGNMYLIDTYSRGGILRHLHDEGDAFLCTSLHREHFKDMLVKKDDVIRVWAVVGALKIYL